MIESDLDGPENRRVLVVDAPESQSFVHAALAEHKRYADPLQTDALVNATTHEPFFYEFQYIDPPTDEWIPPSIRVEFDVPMETVGEFFGSEVTDENPHVRLVVRGPRGDIGFYPADVTLDVIGKAFEVYGYVVAGAALIRFTARWRTGVPFEAVKEWKNLGTPNDELVRFVQRQTEWTPNELANLLDSTPMECRELLTTCGFRPITSTGGIWFRPRDES